MKIKNILIAFGLGFSLLELGAASQDLVHGVDFTGRSNVTQAALNQLVDNATPATNVGFIIVSNGAPSAAVNPKFKRYIWLNTSVNPPSINVYNTNTASWSSNALAADSVATANIQNGAVTTVKIANSAVDSSKLADDSVTSAKIVDGSIAAVDLGNNIILREKIYPSAISWGQITNNGILSTNIATNTIYNYHLAEKIYATNIQGTLTNVFGTNTVYSTNIGPAAVSNVNMAASSINYTNLGTNTSYLIPKWMLHLDGDGNILSQMTAPGLSPCTVVSPAAGLYTITFGNAFGNANAYWVTCVARTNDVGRSRFAMIASNTTTYVTTHIDNGGGTPSATPTYTVIFGPQ